MCEQEDASVATGMRVADAAPLPSALEDAVAPSSVVFEEKKPRAEEGDYCTK